MPMVANIYTLLGRVISFLFIDMDQLILETRFIKVLFLKQCMRFLSDRLHNRPSSGPLFPLPHRRGPGRQCAHLPCERRRPRGCHVRVPGGGGVEGYLQQGRRHRPGQTQLRRDTCQNES